MCEATVEPKINLTEYGYITPWSDNSWNIGTNFYITKVGDLFMGQNTTFGGNGPWTWPTTRPVGIMQVDGNGNVSTLATNATPPLNTSTIKAWANITLPDGNVFKLPLYQ